MEIQEDMPILQNGGPIHQIENSGKHIQAIEDPFRRASSLALRGKPWSTGFSSCFGRELCTNVDMEIFFCGTASPYALYPNKSQRFNTSDQDRPVPPEQTMEL